MKKHRQRWTDDREFVLSNISAFYYWLDKLEARIEKLEKRRRRR